MSYPVVVGVERVWGARGPTFSGTKIVGPPDQRVGYVNDGLTGDGKCVGGANVGLDDSEVPRSARRTGSGIGPGAIPHGSDVNIRGSGTNRDVQRCGWHLINSRTRAGAQEMKMIVV